MAGVKHVCTRFEFSNWGCRRMCKSCGKTWTRPHRESDAWTVERRR